MRERFCWIETASIELQSGAGDGAYDLHDVKGTPNDIGKAIAESLAESSMYTGTRDILESNGDLYLCVRIKFSEYAATLNPEDREKWAEDSTTDSDNLLNEAP